MTQDRNLSILAEVVRERLPRGASDACRTRAARFLDGGVIASTTYGDLRYDDGGVWSSGADRSRSRYVHGFLFLADWPDYVDQSEDPASVMTAVLGMLRKWEAAFPRKGSTHPMAYHDETTAQRLTNVAALLGAADRHLPPAEATWLHAFLDRTAELLAQEEFHAAGNNHGMFQDLALVTYAGISHWREDAARTDFFDLAEKRLKCYFASCFTTEGVHVENAPTYHAMISRFVRDHRDLLRRIGHSDAAFYGDLLRNATRYATHAVMPHGVYPPISDTQQLPLTSARRVFNDDEFTYAATQGAAGRPPADRVLVLPESGYAIYRSSWGDPDATYALFQAAYNANYHKHADDNSFILRSRGVDLLSEAGPYGYNYADPLTKYGYSQYAHNGLIVNGTSLPRTDAKAGEVTLTAHEVREDGFRVSGRNGRFPGAVHTREVAIEEVGGHPRIDLVDTVNSDEDAEFELLWNLGPDVTPVVHGHGFELYREGEKLFDAHFTANVPLKVSRHHAETRPHLGWRFPKFGEVEPANVIRIAFSGRDCRIETKMRLNDFSYADRGLGGRNTPWRRFEGDVGLNYLHVPARDPANDGRLVVVFTAIHSLGDFTYNYKTTVDESGLGALYILDDFGDQGAYYLQDHGDRAAFRSVQALIAEKLAELGLENADLVMAGSSKGGAAALLHGLAARAGSIYVGAPQTRIGSFVAKPHPNILRLMTGGTGPEDIAQLDRVLFEAADSAETTTSVTLLVGDKDHHYANHAAPFIQHLEGLGFSPSLVLLPGLTHADIGGVYRRALLGYLNQLPPQRRSAPAGATGNPGASDKGGDAAAGLTVLATYSAGSVVASVVFGPPGQYSYRLFQEGNPVANLPYAELRSASWPKLPPGRYRVRVYHRKAPDAVPTAATTNWVAIA